MKKIVFLSCFGVIFLLTCNRPEKIFQKENIFTDNIWYADSICSFNCSISDTTHPYNIFLTLSNTHLYNYQNLYLFVTIKFPHGVVRVDTIDCFLANEKGKWYGNTDNNFYRQKLLYRKTILFPYAGLYQFQIEQAMRDKGLKGIHAIGFIIEETEKK